MARMMVVDQEIAELIVAQMQEFGFTDCYCVFPAEAFNDELIQTYWHQLGEADTLKFRFSDTVGITADEALKSVREAGHHYFVVDTATGTLCSEFALTNFSGKAAQIHFSMHPDNNSKTSAFLADKVGNMILLNWKDVTDLSQRYLETMYGVTPVDNRVACIFVLKSGFKRLGTLPKGVWYLGKVIDAMLSVRTAGGERYGW